MDRWEDADDGITGSTRAGRVARLGMGGFVKSAKKNAEGEFETGTTATAEVVPSRKVRFTRIV